MLGTEHLVPASALLTLRAAGLSPSALRWDLQQRLALCGFGVPWGVSPVETLPHSRNPDRQVGVRGCPSPSRSCPWLSPEMKARDVCC